MADRNGWATLFKRYTDEQLREFHADASALERGASYLFSRQVHRERRLAAAREMRRRGLS